MSGHAKITEVKVDTYGLADQCDGECTWDLGQAVRLYGHDRIAGSGICLSLASHWIKFLVEGEHLKEYVGCYIRGRTYFQPNMAYFQHLANIQNMWSRGRNWRGEYRAWINKNGLAIPSEVAATSNVDNIKDGMEQTQNAFVLIVISSSNRNVRSSHAVAAWLGQDDADGARFYDPNYGEFSFASKENFYFFFHMLVQLKYGRARCGFDQYASYKIEPIGDADPADKDYNDRSMLTV